MGVFIGNDGVTQFSFIEYQALVLVLALCICLGLLAVEIGMKRYQVLPTLFPGMYAIRERRLYFFDLEINDAVIADRLRIQAKSLLRMTLCVVMSYLWQRCVLETQQTVGYDFPTAQCNLEMDCFASDLHLSTLMTRQYQALDCSGEHVPFENQVVVSCIRFVKPAATEWLMHLAIAQALIQMNVKCYEVCSQIGGNSWIIRRLIACLFWSVIAVLGLLFFLRVMTEFVSSWLSFVMTWSVPVFMWTVWKTSKVLQELQLHQAECVQRSLEEHFNNALSQLPGTDGKDANNDLDSQAGVLDPTRRSGRVARTAKATKAMISQARESGKATLSKIKIKKNPNGGPASAPSSSPRSEVQAVSFDGVDTAPDCPEDDFEKGGHSL